MFDARYPGSSATLTTVPGLRRWPAPGAAATTDVPFAARFGRILKSYPRPARVGAGAGLASPTGIVAAGLGRALGALGAVGAIGRAGFAAAAAQQLARLLAALAAHAERRAGQWRRAHLRRQTAQALRGLDARTLRDVGLTPAEVDSAAAEVAGDVEATRLRAWRDIGAHVL